MSGRPKDPVWEHGVNLAPGWRCNYCGMQRLALRLVSQCVSQYAAP
jgi:hypothetical protein